MSSTTLANSLDENLFSEKIFKKCYVFYAFWIILSPILETIFGCFGLKAIMMFHIMLASLLFCITKILELIFNWRKIKLKNFTIIGLLIAGLFLSLIVSAIVNKSINTNFMYAICYFLAFWLFFSLDKKYYKAIAVVFIVEMTVDSVLGLIDLENLFIPGFVSDGEANFAMSMQFLNPNWSAFVVIIATMLSLWLIYKSEKIWQKICFNICYAVLVFGLFVGGSFAPETALFLCELALLVILWIKTKKCPWWILANLFVAIFASFAVWFFPKLGRLSTASANYFYEALAVIDRKLHTHLVKNISTFFNKLFGWRIIDSVAGSDGWARNDLMSMAFSAITSSPKSFMFGYGCGYIYNLRVHNCYVALWLDTGFISFAIFMAIIVYMIISFAKSKSKDDFYVLFLIFCMLLFESMYCCIEPICYIFFVIFSGVLYKIILDKNKENEMTDNKKIRI